MKKIFIVTIIILLLTLNSFGEKIYTFTDINKPNAISINKNSLFISENTSLSIYSLTKFKLIKKFGKEGEGPMEFKKNHMGFGIKFTLDSNRISINSETKLSFFNLNGKFIEEHRVVPLMNFIPAGKKYISRGLSKSKGTFSKISISLFNSKFKKEKDLFISNIDFGMGAKIPTPMYNYDYTFYKDKIYVSTGSDGIRIDVFDINGKKELSVIKDLGKRPLSGKYISSVKGHYKTDPRTKNFWEYFKKNLLFLSNFPGIRSFNLYNDKIYVQTYLEKDGKTEWNIFNLKGSELGRIWLPSIEVNPIATAPYTIFNGFLYWITENDEEEGWDLNKYKIPQL